MPGLPEYVRVFTAIELSETMRAKLHQETRPLIRGIGRVTSPPPENIHVTLKFVGDVHRDDIPGLSEAVADGAGLLVPGEVTVEGIGAFPDLRRPRVIWAGVSDPADILTPVHERLNRNLAEFGAKRERKRYVPHVTLARVRGPVDPDLLTARIGEGGEWRFGALEVRAVTLFMSEMGRGGPPRYTALGHYHPRG